MTGTMKMISLVVGLIGIIIGIFVTVIVGLVIINQEPKIELEPQKVNLPKKQSSDDIASIKNEISKLWNAFSSIDRKSEKFFDQYEEKVMSLQQRIGTDLGLDDPRRHLRLNGFNRPVVFIVEYTFTDNHGSYTHSDVFAYREDAEDFVRKLKELPSGVSDISISPRIVYLDKDKTLDNVD